MLLDCVSTMGFDCWRGVEISRRVTIVLRLPRIFLLALFLSLSRNCCWLLFGCCCCCCCGAIGGDGVRNSEVCLMLSSELLSGSTPNDGVTGLKLDWRYLNCLRYGVSSMWWICGAVGSIDVFIEFCMSGVVVLVVLVVSSIVSNFSCSIAGLLLGVMTALACTCGSWGCATDATCSSGDGLLQSCFSSWLSRSSLVILKVSFTLGRSPRLHRSTNEFQRNGLCLSEARQQSFASGIRSVCLQIFDNSCIT